MTAQLLLGLSILVGLHEFGHLLAAKAFGMRVEKYSIGFPPKIWGFQYGETEYSLGAIPLGGFVKISGMIDESLDTESMNSDPEPWEFRSKPAWQRLIVMMGGIIVNVITGIVIFILLVYSNGESFIAKEDLNVHGIVAHELGQEIGLRTGDKVLKVNGEDYKKFADLVSPEVLLSNNAYYTVQRGDEVFDVKIPLGFLDKFSDKESGNRFIEYRFPFVVGRLQPGSGAERGGLKVGDKVLALNGIPVRYFDELKPVLKKNTNQKVDFTIERDGLKKVLPLDVSMEGTVGFNPLPTINFSHTDYTFSESIGKGTNQAFTIVWVNIQAFGKIFRGEVSASKSLSGPIGIAKIFGGTWNWINFWKITGLLSMVLAFMNFLPIPALDGGHVVFLSYEIISGQKPSDKFLEHAQKVGMILLFGIMGFAIFNDLFKTFF